MQRRHVLRVLEATSGNLTAAAYRRPWAQPVNEPLELAMWRDGAVETVTVRLRDRYATFGPRSP